MQSINPPLNEKENTNLKTQKLLHRLIISIAPILFFTIVFSWIFFPEKYFFFQEYVSQLGKYFSANYLSNLVSSIIFGIGFSICSTIFLVIAIIYFVKKELKHNVSKGIVCLIMAVGGALTAIPADHTTLRLLHGIGATLFIAGFGFLNFFLQMLRFTRKHRLKKPEKTPAFYWDLTMTIIVFFVASLFTFFYLLIIISSNDTLILLAQISQKLILIVNCIAIFFIDIEDM